MAPWPELLGLLNFISCFFLGLSNGQCEHVGPGRLFVGFRFEGSQQRKIEESFVEAVQLVGCLAKDDNGGFQLGFAVQRWL